MKDWKQEKIEEFEEKFLTHDVMVLAEMESTPPHKKTETELKSNIQNFLLQALSEAEERERSRIGEYLQESIVLRNEVCMPLENYQKIIQAVNKKV